MCAYIHACACARVHVAVGVRAYQPVAHDTSTRLYVVSC